MDQRLTSDLEQALARTQGLWGDLRKQRVFITGGTGFFGRWLLELFCRANDEFDLQAQAVVLTRNPQRYAQSAPGLAQHPAICLWPGDFQSFQPPEGHFAYVLHAATETDSVERPLDRGVLFEANLQGTRRVLELTRRCQPRKLLFVSSGAAYGRQPADLARMPESCLVAPDTVDSSSAYGQSKRASEFLCTVESHERGLDASIARCFAFVGPYLPLDANYAIGNFIRDALRGGPIRISGDGTPLRSYLYTADLAIWLWTLLLRGRSRQIYNVGSDNAVSIGDLARLVAATVNPNAEVLVARSPVAGEPPHRYIPDIGRARTDLGLDAWVGLGDAIDRTANWYREHSL